MPRLSKKTTPELAIAGVSSESVNIPTPNTSTNFSFWILALIAVISIFQTIQLYNISGKIINGGVKVSSSSDTSPGGDIQSMVGGC